MADKELRTERIVRASIAEAPLHPDAHPICSISVPPADARPPAANSFAFTPAQLHTLLQLRSKSALDALGGAPGLAAGLRTNTDTGLSADETVLQGQVTLEDAVAAGDVGRVPVPPISWVDGQRLAPKDAFFDRKRIFGTNRLPRRRQKSFLKLLWIAFNDKLLILLTVSALISLGIGIYQSVTADDGASNIEWVDGVTVVIAIVVIIVASAANDWQQNHKFDKLNERRQQREVIVLRFGSPRKIWMADVVVGDIIHIEAGDILAADGVLIRASDLYLDESSSSGESDLVLKTPSTNISGPHTHAADPFLTSGTTVSRGVGAYLVTSVGRNSDYGRTLLSLREDVLETPLQAKLGRLGRQLITFGAVAGFLFFIVLFIGYLTGLKRLDSKGIPGKAGAFFHILVLSITVFIITVPEGLALNVSVALAFATNPASARGKNQTSAHLAASLSDQVKSLIKDNVSLNSTALESQSMTSEFYGSSTETALLKFARDHMGMGPLATERARTPIISLLPFDPNRKWMAVLTNLSNGGYRLLIKGAAEILLEYCAFVVEDPTHLLTRRRLHEEERGRLHDTIRDYAGKILRPVAMAYRDFNAQDILGNDPDADPGLVNLEWLASGLILVGVFGLRDPLRSNVVLSVRQCQDAGVFVRMVTGDNFVTAKAVALECGIFTPGGLAMDGPTFRRLSPSQLDAVVPRLQILARSSPQDKLLLVSHLRKGGDVVAVTGDGSNDALALRAADVGLAMGVHGTEVAKEAASIILLDYNFASIVSALSWGGTVNDAVKKFCQFQFTINVTAGILTVVSMLTGESIFIVVQLLWINLIMDVFASLGLATDHPSPDLLKRKPEPRDAPIISITIWKMILGQAIYQLAVVFTVHYAGPGIFNLTTEFEVDNKLDIWNQGLLHNPWFLGVQALTLAGQFTIIFRGGEAFDTVPLTGAQWGWSVLLGFLTIPLGALIRQVPDALVSRLFAFLKRIISWSVQPLRSMLARSARAAESSSPERMQICAEHVAIKSSQKARYLSIFGRGRKDCLPSPDEQAQDGAQPLGAAENEPVVELSHLLNAAKARRSIGKMNLQVHPGTMDDDSIFNFTEVSTQSHRQKPVVKPSPTRQHPRRMQVNDCDVRQAPERGLWSVEGLLRSKRR